MTDRKYPKATLPDRDQIKEALKVLREQQVHVFQALYFNGYRVWNVEHPQFYLTAFAGDDELLDKIELIEQAIEDGKLEKISSRACCPLAEHRSCVCIESFSCPLHGTHCHGSHD